MNVAAELERERDLYRAMAAHVAAPERLMPLLREARLIRSRLADALRAPAPDRFSRGGEEDRARARRALREVEAALRELILLQTEIVEKLDAGSLSVARTRI